MAKRTNTRASSNGMCLGSIDPNELKAVIRDGMFGMNAAEREEFIGALDSELQRANITMKAYLVPLGIPGRAPEELTPTEVGHLLRYLRINFPKVMPAVERVLNKYPVFVDKLTRPDRIAA